MKEDSNLSNCCYLCNLALGMKYLSSRETEHKSAMSVVVLIYHFLISYDLLKYSARVVL